MQVFTGAIYTNSSSRRNEVALYTDACELQSRLSDGVAQEEQDAIQFVIQRMTEEYFVTIGPTAKDVTINERTHQGDLDVASWQEWSNFVESELTPLPD